MIRPVNERRRFSLIIQLFHEGNTELDYLQKFIRYHHKEGVVKLNNRGCDCNPCCLVQKAINNFKNVKLLKNEEVWVIFDDDGRNKEIKKAFGLLKEYPMIQVAFMKPCIEIWPLLHVGNEKCTTQHQAQEALEKVMSKYKHNSYPYFELDKMVDYQKAVKTAQAWEISLDNTKIYHATKFAGIYKLTERIIAAK